MYTVSVRLVSVLMKWRHWASIATKNCDIQPFISGILLWRQFLNITQDLYDKLSATLCPIVRTLIFHSRLFTLLVSNYHILFFINNDFSHNVYFYKCNRGLSTAKNCRIINTFSSHWTHVTPFSLSLCFFVSALRPINEFNWTLLSCSMHAHRRDVWVLWCISVYFSVSPHFHRECCHGFRNIPSFVILGLSPGFRNSCPISILLET